MWIGIRNSQLVRVLGGGCCVCACPWYAREDGLGYGYPALYHWIFRKCILIFWPFIIILNKIAVVFLLDVEALYIALSHF